MGKGGKEKYSELSSTKSSLHLTRSAVACKYDMLHFASILLCLINIKRLQAISTQ